jgi:hypothetical protein
MYTKANNKKITITNYAQDIKCNYVIFFNEGTNPSFKKNKK